MKKVLVEFIKVDDSFNIHDGKKLAANYFNHFETTTDYLSDHFIHKGSLCSIFSSNHYDNTVETTYTIITEFKTRNLIDVDSMVSKDKLQEKEHEIFCLVHDLQCAKENLRILKEDSSNFVNRDLFLEAISAATGKKLKY